MDNPYLNTLLLLIISYFLGSFPSEFIAGKIKKIDIRYSGSRNVGGMNTFSTVGKLAGILVLAADFGKNALAAFVAPLSFVFLCFIILPVAIIVFKDTYFAQGSALLVFPLFMWAW